MKAQRYAFPASIELEYRVEGSDAMTELSKGLRYAKDALS
jgi:hypothetical protein